MTTARRAASLLAAALVLVALAWLAAGTARAAFPGENGRIAFTKSSDVWVMNPDGSEKTRLTCGGGAEGPTWSPDGERIAFGMRGIWVMDADGRNRTAVGGASPDGRRLALDAHIIDVETAEEREVGGGGMA